MTKLDAELTSLSNAGCTACGRVFKSAGGFDQHRRGGKCLDPATIGMQRNARGHWRVPRDMGAGKDESAGGDK